MGKWSIYTPDGVQDILPGQCRSKRNIEGILREHLGCCGYYEIETPSIEFYDVFDSEAGFIPQETLFKLFDREGRILVLRPDFTIPVARMAATKLKNSEFPCRLFYIGNTFRYDETGGGKRNEFTQAGVELLGASGAQADAEIIAQAVYCLKKAGLSEFQIDIGQVDFFKGIMEDAGFSLLDMEEARSLIDKKDYPGLEDLVAKHDMDEKTKRLVLEIPGLFGDSSILESLDREELNERSSAALKNLKQIFEILKYYEMSDYVSPDLGMVSSLNYYTGMIFKGFTHGVGYPVLSGGRYDSLVGAFGKECPATGFSIGVNLLLTALKKADSEDFTSCNITAAQPPEVLIIYANGEFTGFAVRMAEKLRSKGIMTEIDITGKGWMDAVKYAKDRGIRYLIDAACEFTPGTPDTCLEALDISEMRKVNLLIIWQELWRDKR